MRRIHDEEEVIVCVVPKLQGLYRSANPAFQGEKSPIDKDDH